MTSPTNLSGKSVVLAIMCTIGFIVVSTMGIIAVHRHIAYKNAEFQRIEDERVLAQIKELQPDLAGVTAIFHIRGYRYYIDHHQKEIDEKIKEWQVTNGFKESERMTIYPVSEITGQTIILRRNP